MASLSKEIKEKAMKIGFIVNPIAGMGGSVGLKGTDGEAVLNHAIFLGAKPRAPKRGADFMDNLCQETDLKTHFFLCYGGQMGADILAHFPVHYRVIGEFKHSRSSSEDTRLAAQKMKQEGVDILVFGGGDGTARDIYEAVGQSLPVIGLPLGVKIHSGVFAITPKHGAKLVSTFLKHPQMALELREVMDIDEDAFREGHLSAKLYGYMKVPFDEGNLQKMKMGGSGSQAAAIKDIGTYVANTMERDVTYLIGPGSSTQGILEALCQEGSLLGVDAVLNGQVVGKDLNENQILDQIGPGRFRIVVSVIGNQGYIFGRGNQQFSPKILKMAGKENIMVVATSQKIADLGGRALLVDTGEEETDEMLRGFYRVIYGEDAVYIYECR